MPPAKNKSTTSPLPPINGASGGVTETIFNNPFILPGDDQIFRMREEEKRRKEGQREDSGKLEVWQKNKTDLLSRSERLKDLIGGDGKTLNINDVTNKDDLIKNVQRRSEKENMTEYIAKKREMFLVQMSLDTKREEIRKLEEKAQMKEEALLRSEQMYVI